MDTNYINIHNDGRTVYLFSRDSEGNRIVTTDDTFYPYYYEPSEDGEFKSYYGEKLTRVYVPEPWDVRKQASSISYSADIPFTKQYVIDKVPHLGKVNPRVLFIDIEILCTEMPKDGDYSAPISSIAVMNYDTKNTECFFAGNYEGPMASKEKQLLTDFIVYITECEPDLILFWNKDFDYPYLCNRYKDFAKEISPVGATRYGGKDTNGKYTNNPVGISILDYMEMFKKFTLNKWPSYALDNVLEREFGMGKVFKNVDFSTLNEELMLRNIDDVVDMGRLEDKHQLIPYFGEIRRISKCDWEELPSKTNWINGIRSWNSNNSKIVESFMLQIAKEEGFILPNKPKDVVRENYDGAFRECYKTGRFNEVQKADLTSAYPTMMKDFCLDPRNFVDTPSDDTITIHLKDRLTDEVTKTYYVKQDHKSLIPLCVARLLEIKDRLKAKLSSIDPSDANFKHAATQYKAIKSIVNTLYGACALPYFRMYDIRVAECTTFLVRDVLDNTFNKLQNSGSEVIYTDTDAQFYLSKESHIEDLNKWVKEWGWDRYNNGNVTLEYEHEGCYSSLLLIAKCRYVGNLVTPKGVEYEVKGIEIMRKDAPKFMKEFQKELIDKILANEEQKDITQWVWGKRLDIRLEDIKDISGLVKVANKVYKTEKIQNGKVVKMPPPKQVRAFLNFNKISKDKLRKGEEFRYVNMLPFSIEDTGHAAIHMGFKNDTSHIDRNKIDWNKVIELNIDNKAKIIFDAMGWEYSSTPQLSLL